MNRKSKNANDNVGHVPLKSIEYAEMGQRDDLVHAQLADWNDRARDDVKLIKKRPIPKNPLINLKPRTVGKKT
jgi:hypothetical protein